MLVEDHQIVRDGLRFSLEFDKRYKICAEAGSIEEAIGLSSDVSPHLILLDLKLPDCEGISGYKKIKSFFPNAHIMVLTAYIDRFTLKELIREGLKGCFMKQVNSEELLLGIENLLAGDYAFDSTITNEIYHFLYPTKESSKDLSDKERYILTQISEGKMNKEIAVQLNVSEKTIRNNISTIYKKINVTNRTEAASYWIKSQVET